MNVIEKIHQGVYQNKIPLPPPAPATPSLMRKSMGDATIDELNKAIKIRVAQDEAHRKIVELKNARHEEERKLINLFKADLEEEFDLKTYAKNDKLFNLSWSAWSTTQSLTDVYHKYKSLADLVK